MYELLVVVHILSAMAWVGGAGVLLLGLRSIRGSEGHAAVDRTMDRLDTTMKWFFLPAPPLIVGTGVAMVAASEAWSFSQPWVYLALGLFVVEMILGGGIGDRWEKQMREARRAGKSSADIFDRFLRLGAVNLGILVVIVFLMAYKPI